MTSTDELPAEGTATDADKRHAEFLGFVAEARANLVAKGVPDEVISGLCGHALICFDTTLSGRAYDPTKHTLVFVQKRTNQFLAGHATGTCFASTDD